MTSAVAFPCPKCKTPCEKCGEVYEAGDRLDVYQCEREECAVEWVMEGIPFPTAYTWLVGADGLPRDPDRPIDPGLN